MLQRKFGHFNPLLISIPLCPGRHKQTYNPELAVLLCGLNLNPSPLSVTSKEIQELPLLENALFCALFFCEVQQVFCNNLVTDITLHFITITAPAKVRQEERLLTLISTCSDIEGVEVGERIGELIIPKAILEGQNKQSNFFNVELALSSFFSRKHRRSAKDKSGAGGPKSHPPPWHCSPHSLDGDEALPSHRKLEPPFRFRKACPISLAGGAKPARRRALKLGLRAVKEGPHSERWFKLAPAAG